MSKMAEQHYDATRTAEPKPPFTMDEWNALRHNAACEAWRDTNLAISYDTSWRIADAVLRYAMPDRVPRGDF